MGDSQNVLASGHDFTGSLSFFHTCRYGVPGQNSFFTLDIDISTTFLVSCRCGFPLSIQSIYDPGLSLALDLNKYQHGNDSEKAHVLKVLSEVNCVSQVSFMEPFGDNESSISTLPISSLGDRPFGLPVLLSTDPLKWIDPFQCLVLLAGVPAQSILFSVLCLLFA